MRRASKEYLIFVGGNRADVQGYVTEKTAYTRRGAMRTARSLSRQYPWCDIIIEEWENRTSRQLFKSGLYMRKVVIIPAKKEVQAA